MKVKIRKYSRDFTNRPPFSSTLTDTFQEVAQASAEVRQKTETGQGDRGWMTVDGFKFFGGIRRRIRVEDEDC